MSSITWFTLEEFGKDFRETYLPPKVNDLAGRDVKLYYSTHIIVLARLSISALRTIWFLGGLYQNQKQAKKLKY